MEEEIMYIFYFITEKENTISYKALPNKTEIIK